ncbi:hypothetical protein GCM10011575_42340 [Microlunatus endophyticus]|uniref:Uncharacterized protein n=1 Tax=Microlunatus endophyticus TaxID=1716077 RepID=A0A917SFQ7_9ACTN|nr:hypothetical protein [Microlunatus endophyticus]GGL79555.1 hypothetical protein GCM10011575_42340 [Microlunatus endophyticus]
MLERLTDRVTGEVSAAVQRRAANRLPVLAIRLLEAGISLWRNNGWFRFDDSEISCSVQLYRWLQEARRANRSLVVIEVSIEHLLLTPDMIEGLVSPSSARRPDIRFTASDTGLSLECKRLLAPAVWHQDYVHKGMERFVTSAYGAGESLGLMVGYLQDVTVDACLPSINKYIAAHTAMGNPHQLSDDHAASYGTWYRSDHARSGDVPIHLSHVWINLN